jgi:endonuclease III
MPAKNGPKRWNNQLPQTDSASVITDAFFIPECGGVWDARFIDPPPSSPHPSLVRFDYFRIMTRKERFRFVFDYFQKNVPVAETELVYDNPYQLLVAVILSAQCTDKRVNMTTPALFERYPDVNALHKASFDELFPYIKSISYPNNKTKHLIGMANKVVNDFGGKIPMTIEELMQLPGVGRKTANVITSVIDEQPNMAVDTHVFRVSRRIGLVPSTASTPLAVEKELVRHIPKELIHKAHHWLILHGRYICVARVPRCEKCGLRPVCHYFHKTKLVFPED